MRLLLAAIAAIAAAVLELSLLRYIGVDDAHPHPVLVLVVVWTIVGGLEPGLVCAFVGGLLLDLLAVRPLGSSAFALIVAAGGAAVFARTLVRVRAISPVVAVPALSLTYSLTLLGVLAVLGVASAVEDPIGLLLPGVVYDGALGVIIGPLAVAIRDRRMAEERVNW